MLQRICDLLPCIDKMFVALAHQQIEVLVRFPSYDAIVLYTLLVIRESTPAISVQSVQEGETGPI